MANSEAAGKSFKGFGSLDNREWKCPFAKSAERQQALHCFNVSEAWIILSWIILSGMIQSWSNIALTQDGTNIPKKSEVNLERILLEQFVN